MNDEQVYNALAGQMEIMPALSTPPARTWSALQLAIFELIEHGTGNIFIRAVAGSGKSTTIVEGARNRCGRLTRIFLAFNKPIADELQAKGVHAKTFHSVCNAVVKRFKQAHDVDTRKLIRLFNTIKGTNDWAYSNFVRRLVGLGKQDAIGCKGFEPNMPDAWYRIIKYHNMELESDSCNMERAVDLAMELLDASNADPMYDFDDMLYLTIFHDLSLQKYDVIFVDEWQDTNAIQGAILKKMMHETSRVIAVGDENQAIYGFRGAGGETLKQLGDDFQFTEMPLSVTYRCDDAIVQYAQQWVPAITAREGAGQGVVTTLTEWDVGIFQPDDLIVCRTMRALVQLGFKMIRAQIPANIKGKEIGEGMRALIKRMGTENLDDLSQRLVEWRDREMAKALKDENQPASESIQDKADALLAVIDGMPEDMRNIEAVYGVLEYLFNPNKQAPTLSTIHRAKGLEAKRVFWLDRDLCPPKWVKGKWQLQQEENLMYVATTRAKHELYFISSESMSGFRRGAAATM